MEVLIIVGLAAVVLLALRSSNGAGAPHTAPEVAQEAAGLGFGFPLAIMLVIGAILIVMMLGAMATGGCDLNEQGACFDAASLQFDDLTGTHAYSSPGEWWQNRPSSIR